MLLGNFLANITTLPLDSLLIYMAGFMGALALIYAVLLETEKNQDAVFVVASASLFLYAYWVHDKILMFAMAGIFLVTGRELIQILRGKHRHSKE